MSEDDFPTGPEILAMVRPAELFGERLGDARAVRKRWARIARAFRDTEPDVFQHARRLFEQARDGNGGTLSFNEVLDTRTKDVGAVAKPQDEVESSVAAPPIVRWLAERNVTALAQVIEVDPGSIAGRAPMFAVLMMVLELGGGALTTAQLDAVRRESAHHTLTLSPKQEHEFRSALFEVLAIRGLGSYSWSLGGLGDLVDASRRESIPAFVQAMDNLVNQVSRAELVAALRSLRTHKPALWRYIGRAIDTFSVRSRNRLIAVPIPNHLLALFTPSTHSPLLTLFVLFVSSFVVASLLGPIGLWCVFGTGFPATMDTCTQFVLLPTCAAVCFTILTGYPLAGAVVRRVPFDREEMILRLTREYVLFPSEVFREIRLTLGPRGAELGVWDKFECLADDPMWLAECWTDEHARRLLTAHEASL